MKYRCEIQLNSPRPLLAEQAADPRQKFMAAIARATLTGAGARVSFLLREGSNVLQIVTRKPLKIVGYRIYRVQQEL